MRKIDDTTSESLELVEMIKQKPQIDAMVKYYKEMFDIVQDIQSSIEDRIKAGGTIKKSYLLGFIPVKTKAVLDSLEIYRLKEENIELENEKFNISVYYQNWSDRLVEYEDRMDVVTVECNKNFDETLEKAKTINTNPILATAIFNYKNENNDQNLKNEFYLFLKQSVSNFVNFGKNNNRK